MPAKRKSAFSAALREAQGERIEPDVKESNRQNVETAKVLDAKTSELQNVETSSSQDVKQSRRQIPKTSSSQDVKTSKLPDDMKQQTVYLPKQLALRLKAHAAITEQDISGIITRLVEQYLDREEK